MKRKRVLNRFFVAGLAAVLLVLISIYKIPHFINVSKLEDLGYDDEAIAAIYAKHLQFNILANDYYSPYLNTEIKKDDFLKDYLHLYAVSDNLNEAAFRLYDRLKELRAYSDEELTKLYAGLNYDKLTPLLVYDKIENIDQYINDALSGNTASYLHPYENVRECPNPDAIEAFISVKFSIGEYAPLKLVEIPSRFASSGLYLESRGLEAFTELCQAMEEEDLGIYAVDAYRSYTDQQELYESYGEEGDQRTLRPGYFDNQSGLAVMVVSIENESLDGFKQSQAYTWLLDNAHNYGFIFRYPEGKEAVTGMLGMPYYLRYVGQDLAKEIHESGLSFDEYYMFYLYDEA